MILQNSFFKCLFCNGSQVDIEPSKWVCHNCRNNYPLMHGIPILVRDWNTHQLELDKLSQIKPDWYQTIQDPEDVSPWRHNHRKRRLFVESHIQDWLKVIKKEKVDCLLDLGCGDGNHLSYLKKYGRSIFGSDYNLVRLVRSNMRFPEGTFFLADLLDYPSREDFFDLIFFNHVIEHITNDHLALQSVFSALKPGGLLILGTPNEGASWWQFAYRVQPSFRRQTDHVQFYTADSLSEKMERAGFKILDIKHIGWGPPHFTLDSKIRRYQFIDDAFEFLGKRLFPTQASSLYVLATKE